MRSPEMHVAPSSHPICTPTVVFKPSSHLLHCKESCASHKSSGLGVLLAGPQSVADLPGEMLVKDLFNFLPHALVAEWKVVFRDAQDSHIKFTKTCYQFWQQVVQGQPFPLQSVDILEPYSCPV